MKKIEPYKEQPERIPDEKIEVVFHQGKRLGRCFGEHSFDFDPGDIPSYGYSWRPYDGVDPYTPTGTYSHVNCRSSSAGFYRDAVSKAEEKLVRQMKKKMDDLIREAFLK